MKKILVAFVTCFLLGNLLAQGTFVEDYWKTDYPKKSVETIYNDIRNTKVAHIEIKQISQRDYFELVRTLFHENNPSGKKLNILLVSKSQKKVMNLNLDLNNIPIANLIKIGCKTWNLQCKLEPELLEITEK
ncbi:MAG: hypothetical protein MK193_03960 [Lentisphaeria bacterium]|nr:hypothetical protein [Lentisphaeria bacterium]